jgi:hypothetical protein
MQRRRHPGAAPIPPAPLARAPSPLRPPRRFTERDGKWHHLAVTWTAADNGLTEIYWDGLIAASAYTGKTAPLDPHGAFMLGGEQDCFGGCTDSDQGFYGLMDEVGGGWETGGGGGCGPRLCLWSERGAYIVVARRIAVEALNDPICLMIFQSDQAS